MPLTRSLPWMSILACWLFAKLPDFNLRFSKIAADEYSLPASILAIKVVRGKHENINDLVFKQRFIQKNKGIFFTSILVIGNLGAKR